MERGWGNEGMKEQGVETWKTAATTVAKGDDALHFVFDLSLSLNVPLESRKLAGLTNREAEERKQRHPEGRRVVLKGRGERLFVRCIKHIESILSLYLSLSDEAL